MHQRMRYSLLGFATVSVCACTDAGQPIAPRVSNAVALAERFDVDALTFTSIDVPGATGTFAMDLNARGDVVGRFMTGGVTHGFLRNTHGELTTVDYPGASFTVAAGINIEGDIVGMYALPSAPAERHGYLLRDGAFTSMDPVDSKFTNPLGINAGGEIVGRYCTSLPCGRPGSGKYHGFLSQHGVITTFDVPHSQETNAWKINSRGEIIGGFRYADGINRLFLLQNGVFTTFDLPGELPVAEDDGGINGRGDIVGVYCAHAPCDFTNAVAHGFVLSHGELTTIDFPGAAVTNLLGVSARGSLVGGYTDASGKNHGFLIERGH